jgi:hypothetical protein
MPHIRKTQAGGDSFGNKWPAAGTVIEVSVHQATALLAIRDGGFTEVAPPAADDPQDDPETRFAEVSPADGIAEAPKPRRGRPPKTVTADLIGE